MKTFFRIGILSLAGTSLCIVSQWKQNLDVQHRKRDDSAATFFSNARAIRFSPDSKLLMIAGGSGYEAVSMGRPVVSDWDKRIQLWDVAKNREVRHLRASPIFGSRSGGIMLLMPDFKTLITSWGAEDIKLIDVDKRRPDKVLNVFNGYISSMDVSPGGNILAVGMTREVRFFDTHTYHLIKTYEHGGQATAVSFGRNSRIVCCSWDGLNPHFVDVRTGKRVFAPLNPQDFNVTWSADGENFAKLIGEKSVELWRRDGSKDFKVKTFLSSLISVEAVTFSPNGKILALGGSSSTKTPVEFFTVS